MLKRLFLYSLVGMVVVGFLFARMDRKPEPDNAELAAPTVGPDGVISVGSIRLWRDYNANEVAADNVYKGKPMRVTGRVLAVEKDLMGAATFGLVSGNTIYRTMATLTPDETPRAAAVAKGDTVVVQCTGAGALMRMPMLEHCSIVRPE